MNDTAWDLLAFPRLCLLAAHKPTRLSQAMHNAGFRALGLPFVYSACHIEKTEDAIGSMRALGVRGMSLTIPHKENAFTLVDQLSEDAKKIGAINTVINSGKSLSGHNTDWIGVRDALAEANVDVRSKRVLLFGAGGAAKAAMFQLEAAGAAEVILVNRSPERARETAANFRVTLMPLDELPKLKPGDVSLVINSTPIGSALSPGENPLSVLFQRGSSSVPALFEMVTRDTPLTAAAQNAGATVVTGIRMLLFQALEQFRLFTGEEPPLAEMESALREEYR